MTTTKKTQPETLSHAAKAATTAVEHQRIVEQVTANLIKKTAALVDMETQRASILLDGGDFAVFRRELAELREEVETLKLAQKEAERRRDAASAAENQAHLEATAREMLEVHGAGIETGLHKIHACEKALIDAINGYGGHRAEADWFDETAKRAGRLDLMVNAASIRARVLSEMNDTPHTPPPVRNDTEDDAAFSLRQQNHAASMNGRQDVITREAVEVRSLLDKVVMDRGGAFERSRTGVESDIKSFVVNNELIKKVTPTNIDNRMIDPLRSPAVVPTTSAAETGDPEPRVRGVSYMGSSFGS